MTTLLVAIAIGLTIFIVAVSVVRMLATPPPPEPDPEEAVGVSAEYRCQVCGMELTVTRAQGHDHDAPRHCREEMVEL
jgi:hypothetical protein